MSIGWNHWHDRAVRGHLMNSKLAAVLLAVNSLNSVQTTPVRLTVGPPQPPFGRRNLLDPDGRQRLLRGVNIGVQWWAKNGRPTDPALYADGACPPVNATTDKLNWRQPPVCGVDAVRSQRNALILASCVPYRILTRSPSRWLGRAGQG